jgi:hypothetical protein
MGGVHEEVHEHLLNLAAIDRHWGQSLPVFPDHFDFPGGKFVADHGEGCLN